MGNFIINKQALVTAKQISIPYNGYDGILGLSFASDNGYFPSFIDNLHTAGLIGNRVFSIYLSQDGTEAGISSSELILGGYDSRYTTTEFMFLPVKTLKPQSWATILTNFQFGSTSLIDNSQQTTLALFDTGISSIGFSLDLFNKLSKLLIDSRSECTNNDNILTCTCNGPDDTSFPIISGSFNQLFNFTIFSSEYITSNLFNSTTGMCQMPFQLLSISFENTIVLGNSFLMQFYTYYDFENMQIGIAPLNPRPPPQPQYGYIDLNVNNPQTQKHQLTMEDIIILSISIPISAIVILIGGWLCCFKNKRNVGKYKKKEIILSENKCLSPQEKSLDNTMKSSISDHRKNLSETPILPEMAKKSERINI